MRLVALFFIALVGCSAQEAPATEVSDEPAAAPEYSPFVIDVSGGDLPFAHISFKDVGMSLPDGEQRFVYESIAESLRHELMSRDHGARVRFSSAYADPMHHQACQGEHIYVDLWHGASTPKWGYSLWSGCGADDEFAWNEVEHATDDGAEAATPLAREIALSLDSAVQTGCFSRRC